MIDLFYLVAGDWISFLSGLALLLMSALVLIAYRPFGSWAGRADQYLVLAIALGFAAAGANTLYWQVFGQYAVHFGIMTIETQRAAGDWLDLVFKGGHALSGYFHLKALQMQLAPDERRNWMVFEMPWYPRRRWCVRALTRVLARTNRKG